MFDKKQIESILKVNGIASTAPDEEIRSILLSARFNNDEVQTALMVLRENVKTNKTHVDGLHKVFRTDQALQPAEISQLLGIDVDLETPLERQHSSQRYTLFQVFLLWTASILIATTAVMYYMHAQQMGLFHSTSTAVIKM